MEYGINNYIENLPIKYNINKKISLYNSIKKINPELICKLNKKLYVKSNIIKELKEKKWYNSIIDYLIEIEIIKKEINENNEIYHKINDDYKKYFINSESSIYFTENYKEHLMLYKEAAKEFLTKTNLLEQKNKKEITKKELPDNIKRVVHYIGGGFIILSMGLYLNFFSKFGINDGIIIVANSIMFIIGVLLNAKL